MSLFGSIAFEMTTDPPGDEQEIRVHVRDGAVEVYAALDYANNDYRMVAQLDPDRAEALAALLLGAAKRARAE